MGRARVGPAPGSSHRGAGRVGGSSPCVRVVARRAGCSRDPRRACGARRQALRRRAPRLPRGARSRVTSASRTCARKTSPRASPRASSSWRPGAWTRPSRAWPSSWSTRSSICFADSEDGRAAVVPPRRRAGHGRRSTSPRAAYLRRRHRGRGAWDGNATWARRAVRRLVDVALESEEYAQTAAGPRGRPGERAARGARRDRVHERPRAGGRRATRTPPSPPTRPSRSECRFWAQATYLSALIDVEKGRLQGRREPALQGGRSEAQRHDDARLRRREVLRRARSRAPRARPHRARAGPQRRRALLLLPRSARLRPPRRGALRGGDDPLREEGLRGRARAARRAPGARRPPPVRGRGVGPRRVDRPRAVPVRRRRQEARHVPRSATSPCATRARRIAESDAAMQRLLAAVRSGSDAGGAEIGGASPEVDPHNRGARARRHRRTIACSAGAPCSSARRRASSTAVGRHRRHAAHPRDQRRRAARRQSSRPTTSRRAQRGARRDRRGGARSSPISRPRARSADEVAPLAPAARRARGASGQGAGAARRAARPAAPPRAPTCPICCAPTPRAAWSSRRASPRPGASSATRRRALAKDALRRLDLRLSRLLRRARLGRIETVLGRKRALEVEIEAIRLGYLPQDAVDSLDAARYLEGQRGVLALRGRRLAGRVRRERDRSEAARRRARSRSRARLRRLASPDRRGPVTPPRARRAASAAGDIKAAAERSIDLGAQRAGRVAPARAGGSGSGSEGEPAIRGPKIPEALREQLQAQLDARVDADVAQIQAAPRARRIALLAEVRRRDAARGARDARGARAPRRAPVGERARVVRRRASRTGRRSRSTSAAPRRSSTTASRAISSVACSSDYPWFEQYDLALYVDGFLASEQGKEDEARARFERILRDSRSSRFVARRAHGQGRGHLQRQATTTPAALAEYEKVLKFKATDRSGLYGLALFKSAWCYWRLGNNDEAAKRVRRASSRRPTRAGPRP